MSHMTRRSFLKVGLAWGAGLLLEACQGPPGLPPPPGARRRFPPPRPVSGPPPLPWIDCHAHLLGTYPSGGGDWAADWEGAVQVALEEMDAAGIKRTIVMPPPLTSERRGNFDAEELAQVCARRPQRFSFLAGGGSLNLMIQQAVRQGRTPAGLERRFRDRAEKILALGARGFGELALEHFSFTSGHPYEWAPPDHPLLLLLADLAAERGVPIDLHMEAAPSDLPLPAHLKSPPNPSSVRANIAAFERLLAHNRKARIIWSHIGWGHTGRRTPELCLRLLADHPNLYMSFKLHHHSLIHPLDRTGRLKPAWLEVCRRFPHRLVVGSDQFYPAPEFQGRLPNSLPGAVAFLRALPLELARQIGLETPRQLFRL